jgi:hypothetical protein
MTTLEETKCAESPTENLKKALPKTSQRGLACLKACFVGKSVNTPKMITDGMVARLAYKA